jgi:hypothetical protein
MWGSHCSPYEEFCLWDVMPHIVVDIYTFWNIASFFHSGYHHIPEENILLYFVLLKYVPCNIFVWFYCMWQQSHVCKVQLVKRGRRNLVRSEVLSSVCCRFHSNGMQHCVIGLGVSHILKDHSAGKTPGTTFPATHCHDPEDWYLQGWNLLQTKKRNGQIQHVVLTDWWKMWL